MKILLDSLEPFLAELTREAAEGNVWRKQVRFDIGTVPEQEERISFKVGLILAALIDAGVDGQCILEAVLECGSDDPDVDPKDFGTQNAKEKLHLVFETAKACGLQVLPGILRE